MSDHDAADGGASPAPEGSDPDEDAAVDDTLTVSQVWLVKRGKAMWLPDTQCVQGETFFRVSKWDRQLTFLALGKALQMHTKTGKEKNIIGNRAFLNTMLERRKMGG